MKLALGFGLIVLLALNIVLAKVLRCLGLYMLAASVSATTRRGCRWIMKEI